MNVPRQQVPPVDRTDFVRGTRPAPGDRAAVHRVPLPRSLPSEPPVWGFIADAQSDESHPIGLVTLSQPQHIEAIRALARIAEAWCLRDTETAALLGVETAEWESLYDIMLLTPPRQIEHYTNIRMMGTAIGEYDKSSIYHDLLSEEHVDRVADISTIYRALHLMNMKHFEPHWLFEENTAKVFDGKSPLAAMIDGGAKKIKEVRKHLGIRA